MGAIVYTVTATLPDEAAAVDYLTWLTAGHVGAVVAGGAEAAEVVRLREPPTPIRVQTRYSFPSLEAFEKYTSTVAPALRADGLARFGSTATFERSVGEVVSRVCH